MTVRDHRKLESQGFVVRVISPADARRKLLRLVSFAYPKLPSGARLTVA